MGLYIFAIAIMHEFAIKHGFYNKTGKCGKLEKCGKKGYMHKVEICDRGRLQLRYRFGCDSDIASEDGSEM